MRRTGVIVSVMVMLVALALPALAVGPAWPPAPPPPHPHKLILASGECINLADGQILPKHAHHDNLHAATGAGSQALTEAGHSIQAGTCA